MHPGRVAVGVAVCVVVLVTGATATPLWDVPERGAGTAALGTGTATVSVVSAPDSATIEPGRQGGNVYYLRVPDAEINVTELDGNSVLTYRISIDQLGKTRSSVHAVGELGEGRSRLSIDQIALDGSTVQRQQYEATVSIVLRPSGEEQVLYSETIQIEVEE